MVEYANGKYDNGEYWYSIHEVHYRNGKPRAYTTEPVDVCGDSLKSLRWTLKKMKECLKKSILWKGKKWPKIFNLKNA